MAKYTTELRSICEVYAGYNESKGYNDIEEVISKALSKVFDFDFPIFDENYRRVIETKIVRRYYTREISAETVGLWKHWLKTRMNEIMPYYNDLYKSALIEYNPLYEVEYWKEGSNRNNSNNNGTETGSTTTTGTSEIDTANNSTSKYSDTPQGSIENLMDDVYLTNATINDGNETSHRDDTSSTNSSLSRQNNITSTDAYNEHVFGKVSGTSYSKLIEDFRRTIINIDTLIIEELSDLFFTLW